MSRKVFRAGYGGEKIKGRCSLIVAAEASERWEMAGIKGSLGRVGGGVVLDGVPGIFKMAFVTFPLLWAESVFEGSGRLSRPDRLAPATT